MPRMSSWHSNFGKTTTNPTRHLHPLQTGRHGKSHPRKSQRPSPGAWENPTIWMGDSRIRSFWRMKQKSRSGCYGQWTSVEFLYGGKGCMESRALFLFMEAVGVLIVTPLPSCCEGVFLPPHNVNLHSTSSTFPSLFHPSQSTWSSRAVS